MWINDLHLALYKKDLLHINMHQHAKGLFLLSLIYTVTTAQLIFHHKPKYFLIESLFITWPLKIILSPGSPYSRYSFAKPFTVS